MSGMGRGTAAHCVLPPLTRTWGGGETRAVRITTARAVWEGDPGRGLRLGIVLGMCEHGAHPGVGAATQMRQGSRLSGARNHRPNQGHRSTG